MPTLVRVLTLLDLLFCICFAVPGLSDATFGLFSLLSQQVGFADVPYPVGAGAFFVNLAGVFGVIWNVAMLRAKTHELHWIDLGARVAVIAAILFHRWRSDMSPVFLAFVVTEVVGAVAKLVWLRRPAA